MNNIDLLKEYVNILEKGNNLTPSDYSTIYSVRNNNELSNVVKEIDSLLTKEERLNAISRYEKSLSETNQNELDRIKESCEKVFGIKLDNIEFKKLSNGRDIIAFYDERIGRKRLIDYSYAKSLITEFTSIQNSNELYQTEDSEKNATNIAMSEANSNRELDMIEIEKIKANYTELISRIPINEQYKVSMINKILNQAEARNIKYINLENMVALDKQGNIIEASLTSENEVQVNGVTDYNRNINSIDNQNNETPNEYEIEEEANFSDDSFTGDDFKKIVKEEMEKHDINGSVDEQYDKVIDYSNNLMKLEVDFEEQKLNENEYEFYKDLTEKYLDSKSLERIKTRTLIFDPNQSGYTIIFIISLIAIIVGIIVLIINR